MDVVVFYQKNLILNSQNNSDFKTQKAEYVFYSTININRKTYKSLLFLFFLLHFTAKNHLIYTKIAINLQKFKNNITALETTLKKKIKVKLKVDFQAVN